MFWKVWLARLLKINVNFLSVIEILKVWGSELCKEVPYYKISDSAILNCKNVIMFLNFDMWTLL